MRTPRIFRDFRRLIDAVQGLVTVLQELRNIQGALGPAVDRLEALELSRHQFEAEMSGLMLKAEGKFKAANNAEARERQLKRSYENRIDSIDPDGEEPEAPGDPVPDIDVAGGEADRLQALRLGLAPNDKENRLRLKWAGTR